MAITRPKKQIQDLKMFQINIRVTLDEQLQIEEYSKSYGLSVTQFIRIRSLKKQLPKFSMSGLNRDYLIELSRIGNNINQMAKLANQGNPNLKGLEVDLLNLKEKLNTIKNQLLD